MRAEPKYMEYKGYKGTAEVSIEDRCLSGQVVTDILILYNGETYDELEKSFHNAIDGYSQFCRSFKKEEV